MKLTAGILFFMCPRGCGSSWQIYSVESDNDAGKSNDKTETTVLIFSTGVSVWLLLQNKEVA